MRRTTVIFLLLLIAGDIERNPGPTENSSAPTDNTLVSTATVASVDSSFACASGKLDDYYTEFKSQNAVLSYFL